QIGSLSCISYGTWMLTHKSNIIDNVTDVFLDPYVLLCVVGAVVFIVAFIGCLGALRENIYLLKIVRLFIHHICQFGCCGVSMSNDGYLDWQENQYFNCSDANPSMHRCSVP
ncbi:hypothetical protein EGW08_012043, partial [Elysia chlorotica]